MKKIIIPENIGLTQGQRERLTSLGDVIFYDDTPTNHTWIKRCRGAEVICSRKALLEKNYGELNDVFISCPFVDIGWANDIILKKNNITLVNTPGCNKEAVSEWVIGMLINLLRRMPDDICSPNKEDSENTLGLYGRTVCILGNGNIGSRVGEICKVLEMQVVFVERGDEMLKKANNSDVVVNTLSTNESTTGILGQEFFSSFKQGSYFISISDRRVFDINALLKVVEEGKIAGIGLDRSIVKDLDGDVYTKLKGYPQVYLTRIAARTDTSTEKSNTMMIDNVKAYLSM